MTQPKRDGLRQLARSRSALSLYLDATVLALAVWAYLTAQDFRPTARWFPLTLAIAITGLISLKILLPFAAKILLRRYPEATKTRDSSETNASFAWLGLLAAYLLVVSIVGLPWASVIWIALVARLVGSASRRDVVIMVSIMMTLLYVISEVFDFVKLPPSLIQLPPFN